VGGSSFRCLLLTWSHGPQRSSIRALITGATGFIGSEVVRALLREDVELFALARKSSATDRLDERARVIEGDLFEREDVERAVATSEPDICVHLAWTTEPGRYFLDRSENLRLLAGSIDLLQFLVEAGCERVVVGGTCVEEAGPATIYSAAKRSLHTVIEQLASAELAYVCAHVFYPFGPGENPARTVPTIVRKLLRGEAVAMTGGEQVRHYTHVADLASAVARVALADTRGTIDLCWGEPVTVREFTDMLGDATGRRDLLRYGEVPYHPDEVMRAVGDPGSLERELGWKPQASLRERIDQTVEWWRRQEAVR
jgi:UDP-glucose 4-epimerase